MVISNFLNIFAVSAIILLLTILTVGVFDHFRSAQLKWNVFTQMIFRTIDINSGISDMDGRANATKSLVFQTVLETTLQLYCFIVNPALRLYKYLYIKQSNIHMYIQSLFRIFSWKKIIKFLGGIYFNEVFMRLSCRKEKKRNRIVPSKSIP